MAHFIAFGHGNLSRIGFFLTQNHAEQGGFSVAVTSHQTQLFSPVYREGQILKKDLLTVCFINFNEVDHTFSKSIKHKIWQ